MRAYLSFFRIRFLAGLQYRSAAWAGIATQFVWGGMTLLLYAAFYKTGADAFPMTFPALASYIWLQQALLALFMTWYFDGEILDAVVTGAVAYELCRPADLYAMWFAKGLAVRTSRALLRFAPILLAAALLPPPFRLGPPVSLPAALLFLLSTAMGLCVIVAFSMLIYISAFYTVSPARRAYACRLGDGIFHRRAAAAALFPRSAAADFLRAALRLDAEHAVSDLHRLYARAGSAARTAGAGRLAAAARRLGTALDAPCRPPDRRAGRVRKCGYTANIWPCC